MRGPPAAGDAPRMKVFAFSAVSYAAFAITTLIAFVFLAGQIDHGPSAPPAVAATVDLALLGVFAVQHTVMARRAFKARFTRIVPPLAERSAFVLAASAALLVLFWLWRPIPGVVWSLAGAQAAVAWAVYAGGWLVVI